MSTLARIFDYTRQKFQRKHANEEFYNFLGHMNAFSLPNPVVSEVDFGGFRALNFGTRKLWKIVDASKYTSLQNAVDALEKGIVFLPPQRYPVGAEPVIIDRDDIWLVGMGEGSLIQKDRIGLPRSADSYDNSARGNPAIWFKKVSRCRLINVRVDMNETQGVDIDPWPTAAVQANNCPDITISRCTVEKFGDRHFQQEPRGTATAAFAAIDVRNSDRARVTLNTIKQCRAAAIWGGGLADYQGEGKGHQLISYNRIEDADVGIQVIPTNNVKVVENQLSRISGAGVSITESSTTAIGIRTSNLEICRNQITGVGINADEDIAGIYVSLFHPLINNFTISENQISDVRGNPDVEGNGISVRVDVVSSTLNTVLNNFRMDGNSIYRVYNHGIKFFYNIERAEVGVTTFSCSRNTLSVISQGAGLSRGISIIATTSNLTDGTERGLTAPQVCDNDVGLSHLEYGIFLANPPRSSTTSYSYSSGFGGVVDGNIIGATATRGQIAILGDDTTQLGTNKATFVRFTNSRVGIAEETDDD
jgi:hypothetical protein